jgi:hypothetical protein
MELSPEDYSAVVRSFSAGGAKTAIERRRAPRALVYGSVQVIIPPQETGNGRGRQLSALASDLSPIGVGLLQSQLIIAGETFVLQLPRVAASPLFVRCRAMRSSTPATGVYHAGAQFEALVPADVAERVLSGKEAPAWSK